MTTAAPANLKWKRFVGALKSQWLATALFIPLAIAVLIFGLQAHFARQDAREARIQAVNVDRISKVQDSGRELDAALAGYYEAVSQLGLAERNVRMPGTYDDVSVPEAQAAVVAARVEARRALAKHGGDIQGLRGAFNQGDADRYMAALAEISAIVESEADIDRTSTNIAALGRLVSARNAMIDQAMSQVG